MKVLMTADAVGGVWTYALDLARALGPAGVHVVLATMGPPPGEEQRAEAKRVPNLTLETSMHRLEWMEDAWGDVALAGRWLLALEREHLPDVVHLNGYAHAALPWRAPVLVAAHASVTSWWRAVHGTQPPRAFARYHVEVARGLDAADLVVAPTAAMLDALRADHGPFEGSARIIPHGRDPRSFRHDVPKEDLIVSAGRVWDAAKGLSTLDEAAAGLPWPVVMLGDTRAPDGTQARLGIHARLEGRVDGPTLRSWLARARICAHPAKYEPFGLAPLEAALSGCALVLSRIPPLEEVWGSAAEWFEPGDADALQQAVMRLVDDRSLLERRARDARARATRYTAAAMGEAYLSAYVTLATGAQEESPCAR